MNKELEALEPSVVLKFVDDLLKRYEGKTDYNIYITKDWLLEIKQALLKAQEPKQYLKWEDLEKDRTYKVLLNGSQYELIKRYDDYEYHCDYITLQKKPNVSIFIYEYEKEIFNDLHLERVEE